MTWEKMGAGLYQGFNPRDGLWYRVERTGSWWVLSCGTVRTRYETLTTAKAAVVK